MRRIEILDNLFLQFGGRTEEFNLGLELGALTVLMAEGNPVIRRSVAPECINQLRAVAERFRYALVSTPNDEGMVDINLTLRTVGRPKLRLVQ